MATKHGISTSTQERILMGPGAVYINGVLLGATKGGNSFEINRTINDVRPDGAKGKVKGFRFLASVEAILTVRLMEVTEQNIVYALAGSSVDNHVITGGEISDSTYIPEVSIAAEIKGSTPATENSAVEITVKNALVEGPLTVNLPDSVEAVVELKFHAHFDPSTLTTEPWEITFTPVSA